MPSHKQRFTFWILCLLGATLAAAGCADDAATGGGTSSGSDDTEEIDFRPTRDTLGGDTNGTSNGTDPDTSGTCQPSCQNAATAIVCVNGQPTSQACASGELCSAGACNPPICPVPGQPYGCDGTLVKVCNPDQLTFTTRPCDTPDDVCSGSGTCSPLNTNCTNGTFDCRTNQPPLLCVDGSWVEQAACDPKELCTPTGCQSLCELNNKTSSFLGCEYYAVDMDNDGSPSTWSSCTSSSQCAQGDTCTAGRCTQPSHDDQPFGVTISNPNFTFDANVTITGGGTTLNVTVAPGQLQVVELPSGTDADTGGLFLNQTFFAQSDVPITMHQFNPLNGNGVFSNDASLLLPINALGTHYVVLDYPVASGPPFKQCDSSGARCITVDDCPSFFDFSCDLVTPTQGSPAYVDLVATEDNTAITITSPIAIPEASPFGPIAANTPKAINMNRGNILHLMSPNTINSDISGMDITSDKPIAVFAGVVCANVPNATNYCDHVEQQLFPVSTWGLEYFAAKSRSRGAEPDVWRIIASQDGTQVTLSNDPTPVSLNKGQVRQISSVDDFKITANHPILVGQFLTGSNYPGIPTTCGPSCRTNTDCGGLGTCTDGECKISCSSNSNCTALGAGAVCFQNFCAWGGIGDPAYTLAVPVRQYRTSYTVLTPPGYKQNYLTIITPTGTRPQINGANLTGNPVTVEGMDIYRISVDEGVQQLQNSAPFGIIAYGYDCDVSYAYPGGLNLETIN